MDEPKSNRLTKYFPLLLDALRSTDPTPMRPAEVRAWIRARMDVPADDLTRLMVPAPRGSVPSLTLVRGLRARLAARGRRAARSRGWHSDAGNQGRGQRARTVRARYLGGQQVRRA